jgi:cellulose biosynthesis protein BcsQ
MLISIFSLKGGVGKTSLSYSIAKDLNAFYITNDTHNSIVGSIYDKVIDELNDDIIKDETVVFDGGGFFDSNIKDILKHSDKIIIPLEADLNSLVSLENFIKELQKINKNIIYVLNKIEDSNRAKKDCEEVIQYLGSLFEINQEDIYTLPHTRIFKNIFNEEMGVSELINSTGSNRYIYRNFLPKYEMILRRLH